MWTKLNFAFSSPRKTVDEDSDDEDSSDDDDDESYSNGSVESSGSDTTASEDKRSAKEICEETMGQLSAQRATCKKKAQKKVKKDWKVGGFRKLSEDQLVEGFHSTITSGRAVPMWQVMSINDASKLLGYKLRRSWLILLNESGPITTITAGNIT